MGVPEDQPSCNFINSLPYRRLFAVPRRDPALQPIHRQIADRAQIAATTSPAIDRDSDKSPTNSRSHSRAPVATRNSTATVPRSASPSAPASRHRRQQDGRQRHGEIEMARLDTEILRHIEIDALDVHHRPHRRDQHREERADRDHDDVRRLVQSDEDQHEREQPMRGTG